MSANQPRKEAPPCTDGMCCCSEPYVRIFFFALLGAVLLAYASYQIYSSAHSYDHPSTRFESVKVDSLEAPGAMICSLWSKEDMRKSVYPLSGGHIIDTSFFECSVVANEEIVRPCAVNATVFDYKNVALEDRICLELKPGIVLTNINEMVRITYRVLDTLPQDGEPSPYFGVLVGLYSTPESRNTMRPTITQPGGYLALSYDTSEDVLLDGTTIRNYKFGSTQMAGYRPEHVKTLPPWPYVYTDEDGTEYHFNITQRTLEGHMALRPSDFSIDRRIQYASFTWLDVLGAIGGFVSLLKAASLTLHGEKVVTQRNAGLIRRLFFHDALTTKEEEEENALLAQIINSQLEELRGRARQATSSPQGREVVVDVELSSTDDGKP